MLNHLFGCYVFLSGILHLGVIEKIWDKFLCKNSLIFLQLSIFVYDCVLHYIFLQWVFFKHFDILFLDFFCIFSSNSFSWFGDNFEGFLPPNIGNYKLWFLLIHIFLAHSCIVWYLAPIILSVCCSCISFSNYFHSN